jgi:hypothetical protein
MYLVILWPKVCQALLYYMIAIRVIDKLDEGWL